MPAMQRSEHCLHGSEQLPLYAQGWAVVPKNNQRARTGPSTALCALRTNDLEGFCFTKIFGFLAHREEHPPVERGVAGSRPAEAANK